MPYISKEEVKEMRQKIRKALPDFKISVKMMNSNKVAVTLIKGHVDFGITNQQINHYYFERNFEDNQEAIKVIKTILDIIDGTKPRHEIVYDSDYGSVPNYYKSISVGSWNKPYELTA